MNTKENQRTRLSKIILKNALMELLKEKGSVNKISVRELCDRAQLNRSTFYAHYSNPEDLLNEIENDLLNSTKEHLEKIGSENDLGAHKYILSFLQFIKENDKPFRTLLVDSADPEFRSRFIQQSVVQFIGNLQIDFPEKLEQYIYAYILNGSTGTIIQWIRSNYEADEKAICDLLFLINRNALTGLGVDDWTF